jgi:hypothetical protein
MIIIESANQQKTLRESDAKETSTTTTTTIPSYLARSYYDYENHRHQQTHFGYDLFLWLLRVNIYIYSISDLFGDSQSSGLCQEELTWFPKTRWHSPWSWSSSTSTNWLESAVIVNNNRRNSSSSFFFFGRVFPLYSIVVGVYIITP